MSALRRACKRAREHVDRRLRERNEIVTTEEYETLIVAKIGTKHLHYFIAIKDQCMPGWIRVVEQELVERIILGE